MGLKTGQTQGGGHTADWVLQANGEGALYYNVGAADKTVHIFGDFGSGGTLTLQGSNDPLKTDWATLHDLSGGDIVVTANAIEMLAENPRFIRPTLTGATNPDLHINLLSRK